MIHAIAINDLFVTENCLKSGSNPDSTEISLPKRIATCQSFGWFSKECWQSKASSALELSLSTDHFTHFKDTKIALLLLKHGARIENFSSQDSNLFALTLLHENYDKELIKILLSKINLPITYSHALDEDDGMNLWVYGSTYNDTKLIEALLESGRIPNVNALATAANHGNYKVVDLLLNWGIHPDTLTEDHKTALFIACDSEYIGEGFYNPVDQRMKCVESLILHGANPYFDVGLGESPLLIAKKNGLTYLLPILNSSRFSNFAK